jgi:hypothetical protein
MDGGVFSRKLKQGEVPLLCARISLDASHICPDAHVLCVGFSLVEWTSCEQVELIIIKGILAFQACVVFYYASNILLAFVRAMMGWNPKKGWLAHLYICPPCRAPVSFTPRLLLAIIFTSFLCAWWLAGAKKTRLMLELWEAEEECDDADEYGESGSDSEDSTIPAHLKMNWTKAHALKILPQCSLRISLHAFFKAYKERPDSTGGRRTTRII